MTDQKLPSFEQSEENLLLKGSMNIDFGIIIFFHVFHIKQTVRVGFLCSKKPHRKRKIKTKMLNI